MTVEHTVIASSMGGMTVLSSETLQFKNIEMFYDKLTPETVKKSIEHHRPHLVNEDIDIKVIDNRNPNKVSNYQRKQTENPKSVD